MDVDGEEEKAVPKLPAPTYCNAAGACAAIFFILGILSATVLHDFIDGKLHDGLRAQYIFDTPDAGDFAKWQNSETPGAAAIYTDFYVYHVHNPWAVAHLGAKPNVTEIGPLTYRYMQQKVNITWEPDEYGDVLSYSQWQYYVAADDRTRALEAQNVTSVYVPLIGALANPLAKLVIQLMPQYSSPDALWTNRSIRDIIWGWEDPLLEILAPGQKGLPTRYPGLQANDSTLEQALALHQRQRMRTGALAPELQRQLITWDGMDTMQCCPYGPCGDATSGANTSATAAITPWHSDDAEQISGGFGDQFKQYLSATDKLRVGTYGFGIYRHWDLEYTGQYGVEGVNLYRFQLPEGTLGNDTDSPTEAQQYNAHGPSGLLNLTQCYWGAPIYTSKPRFLDGSPALHAAIDGLGSLDRDKLDTWLGVEPTAGQTLDFHWRIGANIYLSPIPGDVGFTFFPDVTPVYYPILWADRYATADSGQIAEFTSKVYYAQNLMAWAKNGGIALAVFAGVTSLIFFAAGWYRRRSIENAKDGELQYYQRLMGHYADQEGADGASLTVGDSRRPSTADGASNTSGSFRQVGPGAISGIVYPTANGASAKPPPLLPRIPSRGSFSGASGGASASGGPSAVTGTGSPLVSAAGPGTAAKALPSLPSSRQGSNRSLVQ